MTLDEATDCYAAHLDHTPVLIHAGLRKRRAGSETGQAKPDHCHVFFDRFAGSLIDTSAGRAARPAEGRLAKVPNADYDALSHSRFGMPPSGTKE
jgi:hypothetical protein